MKKIRKVKENRKDNADIDDQILNQIQSFETPQFKINESIKELESCKKVSILLKTIDDSVLKLKKIIENDFKENKNINISTLIELLNRKIYFKLIVDFL